MLSHYNCLDDEYNPLGTITFGMADDTVRVLFLRGLPGVLPPHALAIGFVVWFFLTALTAGAPISGGLLVPLMVLGACSGRLFGLLVQIWYSSEGVDPGLFALFGATSSACVSAPAEYIPSMSGA